MIKPAQRLHHARHRCSATQRIGHPLPGLVNRHHPFARLRARKLFGGVLPEHKLHIRRDDIQQVLRLVEKESLLRVKARNASQLIHQDAMRRSMEARQSDSKGGSARTLTADDVKDLGHWGGLLGLVGEWRGRSHCMDSDWATGSTAGDGAI